MSWLEQVVLRRRRRLAHRRNSMRDELFRLETEEWDDPRNRHENRTLYDRNQGELLDLDHVARRMRIGHIRKLLGLTPMLYDRYWCYNADGSRNMENVPVQVAHETMPGDADAIDAGVEGDDSGGDQPSEATALTVPEGSDPPRRRAWGAPKDDPEASR